MSSTTQSANSNFTNERTDKNAYSSTVHKLIVLTNGGAIGLLQVAEKPTNAADRRATILSFLLNFLIYVVLRLCEVELRKNQDLDQIHYLVGRFSHLFGTLAALILIFMLSPTFVYIVGPLWLFWFFVIMYFFFNKLKYVAIPGGADRSDQFPQA